MAEKRPEVRRWQLGLFAAFVLTSCWPWLNTSLWVAVVLAVFVGVIVEFVRMRLGRTRTAAAVVGATVIATSLVTGAVVGVFRDGYGGSTRHGNVIDGRHYLNSHGRYTEVNVDDWQRVRSLELAGWGIVPTAGLGAVTVWLALRGRPPAEGTATWPN